MREFLKKYGLYLLIIILLILIIYILVFNNQSKKDYLTFAMLDVGQGDAIFIEGENGVQVLIDAGATKKVLSELSKVMSFYDREIDIVIMTHPDLDHAGGFKYVFKKYKVNMVFESGILDDSDFYKNIQNIIKEKKIKHMLARSGIKIDLGGAYLEILFPDQDVFDWGNNDGSVIARLVYGQSKFMLTGDATFNTEELVLEKYSGKDLQSDFLKLGHHGANTSSSSEFLKKVKPKYALISVGKNNKYGHPSQQVLDNLTILGTEIFRTDQLGTIIFRCDKIEGCRIKN